MTIVAGIEIPSDLFRHQPMTARRSLIAWAVRMEFRQNNQRARAKQASNVAKNAGWILGMMQDHGDQRRIRAQACRFERRGIGGKSLNVRATTFLLQAPQVGESFDRTVYRIDDARGSDPIGEHQGHVTRPRPYLQYTIVLLEAQGIHPFTDEAGPRHLACLDLVPGEMAEVLPESFLHRTHLTGQTVKRTILRLPRRRRLKTNPQYRRPPDGDCPGSARQA